MGSIEKIEVCFENHNYFAVLGIEDIFGLDASFCKEQVEVMMGETVSTKYFDKFEIVISKNAKSLGDKYLSDILKEDKIKQLTFYYEEGGVDNCMFDHMKDKDGKACQKTYINDINIRVVASKNKEDLKERKIMYLGREVQV